jgi:hypothetical protein
MGGEIEREWLDSSFQYDSELNNKIETVISQRVIYLDISNSNRSLCALSHPVDRRQRLIYPEISNSNRSLSALTSC